MAGRSFEALAWLLVVVLYLGVGTFDHDVWAPVEPTMAGIVWGMSSTGDLAVPRVNDDYPFLDTPPLYYWLALGSARAFGGLSPGALRLPAVLLGLGGLGAVFWLARRAYGRRVASLTLLLSSLTGMFWDEAHRGGTDIAGTAFAFFAFALFARSLDAADRAAERRWDVAFAVCLAASFYAKSLFTAFVVLPVAAAFLLGRARFARLGRILVVGAVAGVVLAVPWAWALHEAGGWDFVRVAFFDNTIGRLLSLQSVQPEGVFWSNDAFIAEKEPITFYLLPLLAYPLPWTPLVFVAVLRLFQRPIRRTDLQSFLALGMFGVPIVLSLASAKSTDYLAPVSFFVFLLLGDLLAEIVEAPEQLSPWQRATVVANLGGVALITAAAPVGLAAVLGSAILAVLGVAVLAAAWRFARPRFVEPPRWAWLRASTVVAAVGAILFLSWGVPALDRRKSYRPFFRRIEPALVGRAVVTTYRDVYRLPLVTYLLDRKLEVVDRDAALLRLSGAEPTAVIFDVASYEAVRPALAALPGVIVEEEGGGKRFRFAANAGREAGER